MDSLQSLIFDLSILSIVVIATFASGINQAYGISPSFPRQEIVNVSGNEIKLKRDSYGVKYNNGVHDPLDSSINIERITYLSTGKFLNATIWFADNIAGNPSMKLESAATTPVTTLRSSTIPTTIDAMAYGVLIDVDSNPKTGFLGVDYMSAVLWNNQTKSWYRLLTEYSSGDQTKIISIAEDNNQTVNISNNNQVPYITLPLDLDEIRSPSSFKVMYYAIINYNPSSLALDMISWIDIPPLEYNIVTTPDPIIIRQGEQSIVGIQLSSSSTGGLISQVMGICH